MEPKFHKVTNNTTDLRSLVTEEKLNQLSDNETKELIETLCKLVQCASFDHNYYAQTYLKKVYNILQK